MAAFGFAMLTALAVSTAQAAEETVSDCEQAIANFKNADPGIQTLINSSAGYAVFPNVGKGGFIVGGARGKGLVFENGKVTGRATMTQATIGAQAGGQSYSELILFQNSTALNSFKSSNFEMSAGVSAVAASEGASKVAKYNNGVAVFTLARKGLMAEAAVGGQKFKFEPTTTR
ncbi:MAG: lipid-binding SYLF domain-containing protein [Limisphaerales bacterium]